MIAGGEITLAADPEFNSCFLSLVANYFFFPPPQLKENGIFYAVWQAVITGNVASPMAEIFSASRWHMTQKFGDRSRQCEHI